MRTTTFSVFDHLPASVREFPKRRAAEIDRPRRAWRRRRLGVALLTWSVADPSLNHATNAPVHNLLGAPGAIAADIGMQLLGLACIAASPPPAFWGWRLVTERRLERAAPEGGPLSDRRRGGGRAGVAPSRAGKLAAADRPRRGRRRRVCSPCRAAFSPARPGRWPRSARPSPRSRSSPSPPPRASASPTARTPSDAPQKAARKAARPGRGFDDEEADDEPGFGMVSLGAVIHALLTAKAPLRRLIRRRREPPPRPAAAVAPRRPSPRAPWFGLRADDDGLTEPAAYAPRAKVGRRRPPRPPVAPSVAAPAAR